MISVNQTQATLIGIGIALVIALVTVWHNGRMNARSRAVQALVAVYKDWYRQPDATKFRTRLFSGDLKDIDLVPYAAEDSGTPDAQLLRDYLGWWEFIAILIHFGLINMAEANAVFDVNPRRTLEKTAAYINRRRNDKALNYQKHFEEWVVLQDRGWIDRRLPSFVHARRFPGLVQPGKGLKH